MKKFTEEYTDQRAWYASKWGEHTLPGQTKTKEGVRVRMPTNMAAFGREEGVFSKAEDVPEDYGFDEDTRPVPSDWREHILREIREHEIREAWSKNVHAPAVGPELAENEIHSPRGEPLELRWHEGEPQYRGPDFRWSQWELGLPGWCEPGDAWFRKHCPPDRFVTDAWEVLEFRMRDDGEAEVVDDEGTVLGESSGYPKPDGTLRHRRGHYQAVKVLDCLIAFRDQERAKWTHEWNHCPPGWFDVKKGINDFVAAYPYISGGFDQSNPRWSPRALELVPLWKRREVEALYREKNPEWRVEWDDPGEDYEKCVRIYQGNKPVALFDRLGCRSRVSVSVPSATVDQARAKFRENYKLKRNELWFQGMPVTMVFTERLPGVYAVVFTGELDFGNGSQCFWEEKYERSNWLLDEKFTDKSERLEAYDRMRRYFYEEHPSKCLLPCDLGPVEFQMTIEGKSVAVDADGIVCAELNSDGADVGNTSIDWEPVYRKLRRWTKSQLAKKPVVFEGKRIGVGDKNDLPTFTFGVEGKAPSIPSGRYRVTVEPMGDNS